MILLQILVVLSAHSEIGIPCALQASFWAWIIMLGLSLVDTLACERVAEIVC